MTSARLPCQRTRLPCQRTRRPFQWQAAIAVAALGFSSGVLAQAPAPTPTFIDGLWQLVDVTGQPLRAPDFVLYAFESGHAAAMTNGTPVGDGFTYALEGRRLIVNGAREEGLLDTDAADDRYPHYNVEIVGATMTWWVVSSRTADARSPIVAFRRIADPPGGAPPPPPAPPRSPPMFSPEGRWRLRSVHGANLANDAQARVYTFRLGQGWLYKGGESRGNGFSYAVTNANLYLSGASGEGLTDTGSTPGHPHHYIAETAAGRMIWWLPDPSLPGERRPAYVFEATSDPE